MTTVIHTEFSNDNHNDNSKQHILFVLFHAQFYSITNATNAIYNGSTQ